MIREKYTGAENSLPGNDELYSDVSFHLLFERIPQGVVFHDASGRIIKANQAALNILGVTEDQIFGRSSLDSSWKTIHEDGTDFPSETHPAVIALKEGKSIRNVVMGVLNPDSKDYRWINISAETVPGPGKNQPVQVFTIFEDITLQKKTENLLKQNEHLLRIFIEHAPAAIAMLDNDMKYIIASRRYLEDYRLEYQDITGLYHYDIFPEIPERWKEIHRRCLAGVAEGCKEDKFTRTDGKIDWVHWEILPWYNDADEIGGIIIFSEVITERKEAEEKILREKQKAEQLSVELARSNKELENFAYIASHDLREPLRMLTNFSKLLASKYEGRLDSQADEYIGFITDGAKRMQELIRDLLTFARITTQPSPFTQADLNKIIQDILNDLHPFITDGGVDVQRENMPVIVADPTQMKQLFQNLISNGIKFRKNENPVIRIKSIRGESEWVFSVSDNGIGIDREYFERIFIIFQRLHTRDEYPGTGIGLSICKRIVERHGGRIWVESEAGKGTSFYFTIPDRH